MFWLESKMWLTAGVRNELAQLPTLFSRYNESFFVILLKPKHRKNAPILLTSETETSNRPNRLPQQGWGKLEPEESEVSAQQECDLLQDHPSRRNRLVHRRSGKPQNVKSTFKM